MNVALREPRMTREEFFAWAQAQAARYEFDGFEPVAMTGGTARHDVITYNIRTALRSRLGSGACRPFGPNAGVQTVGCAIRYPDALVTCTTVPDDAQTIPGVISVFEVLSPASGRTDRIVKLREYRAVPTIRRYVILEHNSIDLTVFSRHHADAEWIATALTADDILELPEVGIDVPVVEFYQDVDLRRPDEQGIA
jgi:Uma2 family endonuclease